MHLKSLKITNFRKFGESNNVIDFVAADKKNANAIAASTTLIVGKNNSGKTTITKALSLIIDGRDIRGSDFNLNYLKNILDKYLSTEKLIITLPILEFEMLICVNNSKDNLIHNVSEFIKISSLPSLPEPELSQLEASLIEGAELEEMVETERIEVEQIEDLFELSIGLKFEIKEVELYRKKVNALIAKFSNNKDQLFKKFIELIDSTKFSVRYYGTDGKCLESTNFKLKNLIQLKVISANNNFHENKLSNTFNKIIKNRYLSNDESNNLESLNDEIDQVNEKITNLVDRDHNGPVNGVLHELESDKRLSVILSSNLDFNKLTSDLIKYEYKEQGLFIPEGQFGLGYTNLMNIVGEIIDYVYEFPSDETQTKINLICIEEPEAFMHPQMQDSFIKYINNAVNYLLEKNKKNISCQLLVTTHSSHILNSKIHSSNSFNNINYLALNKNFSSVVKLSDDEVMGNIPYVARNEADIISYELQKSNDLKFLKKHIKYKVSELFFADAVIFVEGVCEETLLNYYIDHNPDLKKYYISIFNINGAHGQVYLPLIKLIKIPSLIITDIDIERKPEENEETNQDGSKIKIFNQIISLTDRVSTNNTIHKFNGHSSSGLNKYISDGNLHGVFQKDAVEGFCATSFEEAFILQNYNNEILNLVLKKLKPNIYQNIIGPELNKDNLKNNSYKLQVKLEDCKSDFSNELLYQFIINDDKTLIPELPKYINDGLNWLKEEIKKSISMELA
jgi:predicted ATP-dependent endonuclease of OLD family